MDKKRSRSRDELMPLVRQLRFVTVAVVAVAMLASLAASCAAPSGGNSGGLRANLVAGAIELSWTATPAGDANGYQLQHRTEGVEWADLPSPVGNSATFSAVVPLTRHQFRVRAATPPGATPADFSGAVTALYVEPQLPIVRIVTEEFEPILDKDNYVRATMEIDPNGSGFAAYSGTLGIKGRGNSTWNYAKKPYRLKLDSKSPIMGIASDRDWVLLANFVDRSQLRSYAAEQISKSTDLAWTPTFRHVEVILNGDYVGVYQLTEKVEQSSDRVDIEEMAPEDNTGEAVTGGYLMEIDDRLEENNEPGWRTTRSVPVVVKEPDPMTPQQRSYIRNYVQQFEDALWSPSYKDPVTGYAPYLDVGAFIDHWIVQEVTRNGDSFWSSTFFTKDRSDNEIVFGPMWDFDRSMGSAATLRPQPPEGWYARDHGPWVRRLFSDPAFVQAVRDRWDVLAPSLAGLPAQLETLGGDLRPAIDNDGARWMYALADNDEPEFLSTWLATRMDWMTAAFDAES